MESSQSSRERTCPSCSAPAEPKQRWCLECGTELPQSRRPALRSAVGIATTLAVLVGAASAGGYTLLQDGKEPPPPAQTIAQTPPPVATTPTVPPADGTVPTTPTPATPLPDVGTGGGTNGGGGGGAIGGDTGGGTALPPVDTSVPDLSGDLDTSPTDPPPDDDTQLDDDGNVVDDAGRERTARDRQPRPRLVETNIAFGGIASVYAPYGESTVDYGDPSKLLDGTTGSVWKSPRVEDPTLQPQIGVYVELASPERVRRLVLETPTPGMGVEIYASTNATAPPSITASGWTHLTDRSNLPAKTTIPLPGNAKYRYVLIWIRSLAPDTDRAEISEIELIGLAPE